MNASNEASTEANAVAIEANEAASMADEASSGTNEALNEAFDIGNEPSYAHCKALHARNTLMLAYNEAMQAANGIL